MCYSQTFTDAPE
ncbi:hypothetical protein RSAG8_02938, partial [Rhizoctonia solani AG-8 WAC10335]